MNTLQRFSVFMKGLAVGTVLALILAPGAVSAQGDAKPCDMVKCAIDDLSMDAMRCCMRGFKDELDRKVWLRRILDTREANKSLYLLKRALLILTNKERQDALLNVVRGGAIGELSASEAWEQLETAERNGALALSCQLKQEVPSAAFKGSPFRDCPSALSALESKSQPASAPKLPSVPPPPPTPLPRKNEPKEKEAEDKPAELKFPPAETPGKAAADPLLDFETGAGKASRAPANPKPVAAAPKKEPPRETGGDDISRLEAAVEAGDSAAAAAALRQAKKGVSPKLRDKTAVLLSGGSARDTLVLLEEIGPSLSRKQRERALENYIVKEGDKRELMERVALSKDEVILLIDTAATPAEADALRAIKVTPLK